MKEIVLEGEKFVDLTTTHKILKELFDFPDYYGENLDAFWDCITDCAISFAQEGNAKIIWKNFEISKNNLGEKADIFLQLIQEATEKYGGFIIEVIP